MAKQRSSGAQAKSVEAKLAKELKTIATELVSIRRLLEGQGGTERLSPTRRVSPQKERPPMPPRRRRPPMPPRKAAAKKPARRRRRAKKK